jgi:hypothetical protein
VGNRQFVNSAVLVFLLKVLQLIFIDMCIYWDCYMSAKNNMKILVKKAKGTFGAPDMFCTSKKDGQFQYYHRWC